MNSNLSLRNFLTIIGLILVIAIAVIGWTRDAGATKRADIEKVLGAQSERIDENRDFIQAVRERLARIEERLVALQRTADRIALKLRSPTALDYSPPAK